MTIQAEFQAVVLAAGKGSRMLEITSGQPKCLLPIGPKPLIWYTLTKLQKSGFTEVIMIVLETQKAEIQSVIDNEIDNNTLDIKVDYVSILDDKDDLGTADSLRLREVQEKLKSDVLVVSCDLVSDVHLGGVINLFRKHNASVATLMFHTQQGEYIVPGPKSKYKPERDLIGVDEQTSRLVFLASASDFESEVSLPMSLLKKHTNIKMHSTLIDSHIYVLKNWVIQYLKSEDTFMSLKGELIPYIVKKQLSKPQKPTGTNTSVVVNTKNCNDIFSFAKEDEIDIAIREASSYNDHIGDLKSTYNEDSIRCYSYIAPKGSVGVRVNTIPAYWSINGKIQELWDKITGGQVIVKKSTKAVIQSNQLDDQCIIWDGVKLNEKTSFKNCIIGTNSAVNSFSRVFNSIVMQNVTIKEKVALENCIVCDRAVIESGCKLKNCIVGNSHFVPEESEHTNEVLTEALMHF